MDSNEEQELNILFISFTEEVSILDRSIDFNDWHPENIEAILVTDDVFKLDKSIEITYCILLSSSEKLKNDSKVVKFE